MRRVISLALLLGGCAVPASRPEVGLRTPEQLGLGGEAAAIAVAPDWWREFGDEQLDRIVADALAGNPSIEMASARVRQADAILTRRDADRGPSVDLDAQAQAARLSGRYTIPPPFAGTVRFVGTTQAGLNWNLDLFGRQRAAIEQASAARDAARYDAAATRVMIAASVVQAYAEVARAERQAAIARETVDARQGSLRLIETRIRNRLASKLDSNAATTLLAQARGALLRAEAARALGINALAALAGRGSDYAATIGATRIVDAGPDLPATIPADLLSRRADIAAAQARVVAAAAGRQVARRAFYPNVNLSALAGLQAIGISNLFNLDAGTAGAGAAVHLPIFDNGRLKADLEGATAGLDLANADYNKTLVGAVREAADAIERLGAVADQRQQQRAVVAGFAETARLNDIRVRAGLDSSLSLVDNDIGLLDARLADANLSLDAIIARAQLAQALGGGIDNGTKP